MLVTAISVFSAISRYTCRGLFEKDKVLFSFQMCVKILETASRINTDEYNFFLRGGVVSCVTFPSVDWPLMVSLFVCCLHQVLNREAQMDNPCKWLDDLLWDNITELDKSASNCLSVCLSVCLPVCLFVCLLGCCVICNFSRFVMFMIALFFLCFFSG